MLLGGGHAHVAVLRRFAMRPRPGLRLTLVTPRMAAPYSGMLPGLLAGHYTHAPSTAHLALLVDPQTAGSLLAGVPGEATAAASAGTPLVTLAGFQDR